jgi:hypothetical protein
MPCSPTPAGPNAPGRLGAPTRPPLRQRRRLPREVISGLNRTASALVVYASPVGLPTPDARLTAGCWPGSTRRDSDPLGSNERFPFCFLHHFLLSQASWRNARPLFRIFHFCTKPNGAVRQAIAFLRLTPPTVKLLPTAVAATRTTRRRAVVHFRRMINGPWEKNRLSPGFQRHRIPHSVTEFPAGLHCSSSRMMPSFVTFFSTLRINSYAFGV